MVQTVLSVYKLTFKERKEMKTVKIQQELIREYEKYKKTNRESKLPWKYIIKDGKVYLLYKTYACIINANDFYIDLSAFDKIPNFCGGDFVERLGLGINYVSNAKYIGITKDINGKPQLAGIRSANGDLIYVDKSVFNYYETEDFYVDSRNVGIYAISKEKECIGMILPQVVEFMKGEKRITAIKSN
jgi:hypothetical protein